MKKLTRLFPFFFLLLSYSISAQDFFAVDEHAQSTPSSKANSIENLAEFLTSKFLMEKEKARAIYVWMADNIKYSTQTISSRSMSVEQRLKKQEPERVLKSKRAVCEGYSNLFQALCEAAGLQSIIVTGYTKLPNGKIAPVGHAWNMVRTDGQWQLIDVTWGAGGIDGKNGKYVKSLSNDFFMASPYDFIQHHLPHDPLFQLLTNAVTYEEFKKSSSIILSEQGSQQDIHEQLDAYFQLDKTERQLATSHRAVEFDANNGFANFTLSSHYYHLALDSYHEFYNDSQKAFNKKMPLTTDMVNTWEDSLNNYKIQLKKSEKFLENIRPGDPVSEAASQSKSAIKQAWKISKETDKQFKNYRQYLERTGR